MINKIKSFVRKHWFLRRVLFLFHLKMFFYNLLYKHKSIRNIPFKYKLPDGDFIKLYPQGQIAKSLFMGSFEREEIRLFFSFLKPGMHIFDIGANIGLYSIIADKIVSPSGEVWAFEPSTENFNFLLANVSLNKAHRINVTQVAFADLEDEITVLRRDPGFGDGERYLDLQQGQKYTKDMAVNDSGDTELVRVTTLDSYLHKKLEICPKIDFIKMDVEGSELMIFRGAHKTLTENPDIMIFFECAPLCCRRAGNTTNEVFQYLRRFDFEIYAMNKNSHRWETSQELISTTGNVWACRNKEMLPKLPNRFVMVMMENSVRLLFTKAKRALLNLNNLRKLRKIFPKNKIEPIVEHNRNILKTITNWIEDEVYEKSILQYGLPRQIRHLINLDIGEDITYSDAIIYLSSFLKKRVNYLELGVSVGKNFFQIANFLKNSNLTGFDIEEINPILEKFLHRISRVEWKTIKGSLKCQNSSLSEYFCAFNQNRIKYVSGDIFDENSWQRLDGNKYNIIFSDAFHSPDALLHEYEMIKKYGLLDEDEFLLVWDDLHGQMETSFIKIWADMRWKYNLKEDSKLRIRLNGWVGKSIHEIGIITKFNSIQVKTQ